MTLYFLPFYMEVQPTRVRHSDSHPTHYRAVCRLKVGTLSMIKGLTVGTTG